MHESTHVEVIDYNIKDIYNLITDHANCEWREDLMSAEQVDENTFIETVIDGSQNTVRVMNKIPNERYEYTLESKNFVSHWTCTLKEVSEDKTEITIEEQLEFTKKLVGFVSRWALKLDMVHLVYIRNIIWELGGGNEEQNLEPTDEDFQEALKAAAARKEEESSSN